jgi:hypothetical protein
MHLGRKKCRHNNPSELRQSLPSRPAQRGRRRDNPTSAPSTRLHKPAFKSALIWHYDVRIKWFDASRQVWAAESFLDALGAGGADAVTEVAEQGQGLLVAGGGGRVVPGLFLDNAQRVEGVSLVVQVAEVTDSARACCRLAAAAG